jgi:hypothetical protein
VPYESIREEIMARAKPLDELTKKKPASKPLLDAALRDVSVPAAQLRWLPVHHLKGFWTALVGDDGKPVAYFDFDPY